MTTHATGTFDIKVTPLDAEEHVGDPSIGRLSLEKQFRGAMAGTSKGQMLGINTPKKGSGGYVAAERFVGTLYGRKGSFSLQHSGTMQNGKFEMNVTIVPVASAIGRASPLHCSRPRRRPGRAMLSPRSAASPRPGGDWPRSPPLLARCRRSTARPKRNARARDHPANPGNRRSAPASAGGCGRGWRP